MYAPLVPTGVIELPRYAENTAIISLNIHRPPPPQQPHRILHRREQGTDASHVRWFRDVHSVRATVGEGQTEAPDGRVRRGLAAAGRARFRRAAWLRHGRDTVAGRFVLQQVAQQATDGRSDGGVDWPQRGRQQCGQTAERRTDAAQREGDGEVSSANIHILTVRDLFKWYVTTHIHRLDACESKIEIVTPYWASNSAGKVRAIVNTQHFEQAIHQEVCTYVWATGDSDQHNYNIDLFLQQNADGPLRRWMWLRAKVQVAPSACLRSGQRLSRNFHGLVPVSVVLRLPLRSVV